MNMESIMKRSVDSLFSRPPNWYDDLEQLRTNIEEFIKEYYNRQRLPRGLEDAPSRPLSFFPSWYTLRLKLCTQVVVFCIAQTLLPFPRILRASRDSAYGVRDLRRTPCN